MSYIKNTASQYLFAVVVSSVDGSPITTGVSLNIVKDGGTYGAAGASLTHMGAGLWKAALTQADTNGNQIGFVFTGTNTVNVGGTIITQDEVRAAVGNIATASVKIQAAVYDSATVSGDVLILSNAATQTVTDSGRVTA